jgi:Transglutaminase-like superfamily
MLSLIFQAYRKLVLFDLYLARGNFAAFYTKVRTYQVRNKTQLPASIPRVCAAVDMACIWYYKQVLCLQRSAATTCLLREHGVPAELVIGAQQLPFKAHAWVEANGQIVNDKTYTPDMYQVLDRC